MRVFAIDPSLTCSGWSIFDIKTKNPLAAGLITPPPPPTNLYERLDYIQLKTLKITSDFNLSSQDFLVCEGPAQLSLDPKAATKVEQVRGIFESIARLNKIIIPGRVNPRTIQIQMLGLKGKQLDRKSVKECTKNLALTLFPKFIEGYSKDHKLKQDLFDALLIGAYASNQLNLAISSKTPITTLFDSSSGKSRNISSSSSRAKWEHFIDKR